jgi:hypothetical protein
MRARGSSAVVGTLTKVYPDEVVQEQLRQLYYEQLWNVIDDIYVALPSYRVQVAEETYTREKDKLMVLVDCLHDSEDCLSVEALETLLKHLLEQKKVFVSLAN